MDSPLCLPDSDASHNNAITSSTSNSEAAAGALRVTTVSAELGSDRHGNPAPEPGPRFLKLPYRGLPNEIIENILGHMDGKTLKSTRLANRDMAILAGNILRQAIIIDVTPTDDCYSMLYNQIRIHHERSLIPYVRAIRIAAKQCDELMLASEIMQLHIMIKMLRFVAELNNVVHIELDGSNLTWFQRQVLRRDDRLKKWTARSIELRDISHGTFDNFYSWPCAAAFSVDRGIEHRAIGRISAETNGQLQRLALTATFESNRVSRFLRVRPRLINGRLEFVPRPPPITPEFNSLLLGQVSRQFPKLNWLAIRCQLRSFGERDTYQGSYLFAAKLEFLKVLPLLTHLERLSIQVHSYVGFREAHQRIVAESEDILNRKTCQWFEELALEIVMANKNLVEVFVRASWPDYFVATRHANNVIAVRHRRFESFNRHQFPIGLVY